MVSRAVDYPIRRANKEPEWSSICNNVFDQYLDTDDPFGFEADGRERSSSNDSGNLFDFSTGSEQSHQTSATSPIPFWEETAVQHSKTTVKAEQPRAKEPLDFWTKKLKALERNAAESERTQRDLRTAKSHPDFLSLGGGPSPPALPASPTNQSLSVQRQRSRVVAANGRKASQARSVSRGRPSGVTKCTTAGTTSTVNPYATVRKSSASPSKMMTPSRYRAGFKDIWAERTQISPKKYELSVPSQSALPASPPPSAGSRRRQQDDLAAFGSPPAFVPMMPPMIDDQLSPLTRTFQQAHIHTPIASPAVKANAAAHASNSYFEDAPPFPTHPYVAQTVALNDTAPLFPERTSSIAANGIQSFDFGFSSSPDWDEWSAGPFAEPAHPNYTTTNHLSNRDPFSDLDADILPSTETNHFSLAGLGISCDPTLVSSTNFSPCHNSMTLPTTLYDPEPSTIGPYCIPGQGYLTMPTTPHRRSEDRRLSDSPEPPQTDIRSRRSASRSRRSASRHRRTKSTNSTPRQPQGTDKGGFVNYTPHDSNRILSGVAPSGSSKTKARREKEAADKRRRLSQAAMRAVVEVGGDVEALEKAGLLA